MSKIYTVASVITAVAIISLPTSQAVAQHLGDLATEQTGSCASVSGTSPRSRCQTPAAGGVVLNSDPGGFLSQDNRFLLTVQDDENVVLRFYQGGFGESSPFSVLWSSKTNKNYLYTMKLVFQTDGNLVAYETNTGFAQWSSKTDKNPGATLYVQNDGNAVIRRANGTVAWATNTCCH